MNNLCIMSDTVRDLLKNEFKLEIEDIFKKAFDNDRYIKIIQYSEMECSIRHSKTRFNRNEDMDFEDYVIMKLKNQIIKKLRLTTTETKLEFEDEFGVDFKFIYSNTHIFKLLIEITRTENNVTLISL